TTPFPNEIRSTFLRNDPQAYYAANINPWPSITEKLNLIDKPVQLICGEYAAERSDMEADCKRLPQAELYLASGLDHATAYWYSDIIVPLMMSFLDKILNGDHNIYDND
ncbi:MAG: hypothetical protein ACK4PR_13140, partial [Gammaproteobacteria bacterium]